MKTSAALAALLLLPAGACPYLDGDRRRLQLPAHHPPLWNAPDPARAARRWMAAERKEEAAAEGYAAAAAALDWSRVKADLLKLMRTSDPRWPSDYGNYGPLVRGASAVSAVWCLHVCLRVFACVCVCLRVCFNSRLDLGRVLRSHAPAHGRAVIIRGAFVT